MKNTKTLVTTALCIAVGIVLPAAFHVFGAGSTFLPMHIPVLLCGLICGSAYGMMAGILTPILSSLITGMPAAGYLPAMICELAVYGLVSGFLMQKIHSGKQIVNLYLSLILAMIAGRVIAGILNALIFRAGAYSFTVWIGAMFVQGLPGILIQLAVIPSLVLALQHARLIPAEKTEAA